jgi:hypothetical protein
MQLIKAINNIENTLFLTAVLNIFINPEFNALPIFIRINILDIIGQKISSQYIKNTRRIYHRIQAKERRIFDLEATVTKTAGNQVGKFWIKHQLQSILVYIFQLKQYQQEH